MSLKIESLRPSSATVGWEGNLVIHGTDLGEAGFVSIDGNASKVESWTTTQIEVQVTKAMTDKSGKKRIVVHDKNAEFDETVWSVED